MKALHLLDMSVIDKHTFDLHWPQLIQISLLLFFCKLKLPASKLVRYLFIAVSNCCYRKNIHKLNVLFYTIPTNQFEKYNFCKPLVAFLELKTGLTTRTSQNLNCGKFLKQNTFWFAINSFMCLFLCKWISFCCVQKRAYYYVRGWVVKLRESNCNF